MSGVLTSLLLFITVVLIIISLMSRISSRDSLQQIWKNKSDQQPAMDQQPRLAPVFVISSVHNETERIVSQVLAEAGFDVVNFADPFIQVHIIFAQKLCK